MTTFQQQLDTILLADTLHSKTCKKNHNPIWEGASNYCDFHNHNKNRVLGTKIAQATAKQRYIQKSKDILTLCEGMNMDKIIKIVNTIVDE